MGQNLLSIMKENPKVMFGSRKILRKEKKYKEKIFFHVWLSYEKYQRKSNIIKIN